MLPTDALAIKDFQRAAERRLPRMFAEILRSGVDDNRGLERNIAAFQQHLLYPRYLTDVSERSQRTTLFGHEYASPFGVAPTGISGIFRRGIEVMLAEAARDTGVLFSLAGAAMASIERVAAVHLENAAYQLYAARDPSITEDLVKRAASAGYTILFVTVDNPVYPNREGPTRNGFQIPLKLSPSIVLDVLRHPGWLTEYLRHGGMPYMESWAKYAPPDASAVDVAHFVRAQSNNAHHTWRDIEMIRRWWPHKLVIKGILHPADAVHALECGADGVVVSNHGGLTLDRAPATIDALPFVKAAVGERLAVIFDSGVRRGSDIVVARCLGADFVMVGHATLYGGIACGRAGARRAIEILQNEIDTTLGLIGCASFSNLGPQYLFGDDAQMPSARSFYRATTDAEPVMSAAANGVSP
jgi:(S)-mandelate dehydrogenase